MVCPSLELGVGLCCAAQHEHDGLRAASCRAVQARLTSGKAQARPKAQPATAVPCRVGLGPALSEPVILTTEAEDHVTREDDGHHRPGRRRCPCATSAIHAHSPRHGLLLSDADKELHPPRPHGERDGDEMVVVAAAKGASAGLYRGECGGRRGGNWREGDWKEGSGWRNGGRAVGDGAWGGRGRVVARGIGDWEPGHRRGMREVVRGAGPSGGSGGQDWWGRPGGGIWLG